jgi:hypothetical protein
MRRSFAYLGLVTCLSVGLACGGMVDSGVKNGKQGDGWDNPWDDEPLPGGGGGSGAPKPDPCKPDEAPAVFKNALCLCGDLTEAGALLVKNGATKDPASLGINGFFKAVAHVDIDGSLAAYGGLEAVANVEVQQSFWSSSNVNFGGRLDVGGDLNIGGNLFGIGVLSVGGVMGVAGGQTLLGGKEIGKLGAYSPLPGPPCACGAKQVLDVKAKVAAARAQNDNASVGLPPNPVNVIGKSELVLNSGRYYFASKQAIGYTKIVANGAVKIFVDGDLEAIGYDRFDVKAGSSLDIYVAGNLKTVGNMVLGDKHHPSAFRVYIGGSQDVTVQVGNNEFRGSIYAPNATIVWVGRTKVEGSLFAKSISAAGLVELYFSRPTTGDNGEKCTPPRRLGAPG